MTCPAPGEGLPLVVELFPGERAQRDRAIVQCEPCGRRFSVQPDRAREVIAEIERRGHGLECTR